jgi:hypothetical protein
MDAVLFEERRCADGKRLGIATLNSEKSLNALTLEMIRLLQAQLAAGRPTPTSLPCCCVVPGESLLRRWRCARPARSAAE